MLFQKPPFLRHHSHHQNGLDVFETLWGWECQKGMGFGIDWLKPAYVSGPTGIGFTELDRFPLGTSSFDSYKSWIV